MNLTLQQALRYSADSDWHQLVQQMDQDPQHQQVGATLRLVAADAADDLAMHRPEEAQQLQDQARLLRSDKPIYLWRGGVYHAEGSRQGAENFADIHLRHHLTYTPFDGEDTSIQDSPEAQVTPEVENAVRAQAKHFYHSHFADDLERHPTSYSMLLFNYLTPHSDGDNFLNSHWLNAPERQQQLHQAATEAGRFTLVPTEDGRIQISQDTHHWGQQPGLPEDHN